MVRGPEGYKVFTVGNDEAAFVCVTRRDRVL